MVIRSWKRKATTVAGYKTNYVISMISNKTDVVVIHKTYFNDNAEWHHNKRKVGNLFFAQEELVIKVDILLDISKFILEQLIEAQDEK